MQRRLVVIGGGISGLAAAYGALCVARESGTAAEVLVLERDEQVGGKARSLHEDGWLVEAGPGGYLDNEAAMHTLVAAGGLESQRVTASEAAAARYIVRGGRARLVDPRPIGFLRSGLLGPTGLARLAAEPLIRRRSGQGDESVWGFAARRIGAQAAERLIAPMVLGVFAGDARRLSLEASFPRLAELENRHGSLLRGMLALRRASRKSGRAVQDAEPEGPAAPITSTAGGRTAGGPAGPGGRLTSFREGLQSLPLALSRIEGLRVLCGAEVRRLERLPQGSRGGATWRIGMDGRDSIDADAVVLAGEPWAMSHLLRSHSERAAGELAAIACPPVSVVALGFGPEVRAKVPRGFGVLIPRGEGFRILGCLWETYLFEGRSPRGFLLMRMMLGGAVDLAAGALGEAELAATARGDLRRLFSITETPRYVRVVRWPRAIPQYELGHLGRVASIESECARLPHLSITGNGLHGVAFAKAGAHGLACGRAAMTRLVSGTPAAS